MDYDELAFSHLAWVANLWDRICDDKPIDLDEIGRDDACQLGKWLRGEGQAYKSHPQFAELEETHARFHQCAKRAAAEAQDNDKDAGLLKLEDHGECRDITDELLRVSRLVFDTVEGQEG